MPPLEREGHTSTMVGPLMYVYGGSSEVGYLDDVYALNVNPGLPGSGEELPMAWGHIDVSGPQPVGREGHSRRPAWCSHTLLWRLHGERF